MPSLHQEIGKRVRTARLRLELTQEQLAEQVEMEAATVRAVEAGRRGLSVESLLRLAQALHLPAGALLEDSGVEMQPQKAEAAHIIGRLDEPWRSLALRLLRDLERTSTLATRRQRNRSES